MVERRRRKPHPYPNERRHECRRETDKENEEIHDELDQAAKSASLITRLMHSLKVGMAIGGAITFIASIGTAIGVRVTSAGAQQAEKTRIQVDSNTARIDREFKDINALREQLSTVIASINALTEEVQHSNYIQCVTLRLDHPELRDGTCQDSPPKPKKP